MKARENPFRSDAVASLRYRLPGDRLRRMADRICRDIRFFELLGPEGSGKTTLLEDLHAELQARGRAPLWLRLNRDSPPLERRRVVRRLRDAAPDTIACFDGGEVLGRSTWWRLRRTLRERAVRGVVTLHRTRGLPLLHRTAPDLATAEALVAELVGREALRELRPAIHEAFTASHGNVREVFRACYLSYARLAASPSEEP